MTDETPEMVERVALAIGREIAGGEVQVKGAWEKAARAAIEAMREPTGEMCEAFYQYACSVAPPDPTDYTPEITKAVNAMIDAALGNGKP